jgi:hypothetical protein
MALAKIDQTHGMFWADDRYKIVMPYHIMPAEEADNEDNNLVDRLLIIMQNTMMEVCQEQGWKQELQALLDAEWGKHLGKSYSGKEMQKVSEGTWDAAIHQFGLRHPEINRLDGPFGRKLEQLITEEPEEKGEGTSEAAKPSADAATE